MEQNAGSAGNGSGFKIKGVASAGGKVGGKISRRPRHIHIGQPLTSQEMLFIADGISTILSAGGDESEVVERTLKSTASLLMAGKWHLVFSQTRANPIKSLTDWKEYLVKQWELAYGMVTKGELTDEDNEWLRSLRNVSEAYDTANNTKTKWSQEAKKLA